MPARPLCATAGSLSEVLGLKVWLSAFGGGHASAHYHGVLWAPALTWVTQKMLWLLAQFALGMDQLHRLYWAFGCASLFTLGFRRNFGYDKGLESSFKPYLDKKSYGYCGM